MSITCLNCATENPDQATNCERCGVSLNGNPEATVLGPTSRVVPQYPQAQPAHQAQTQAQAPVYPNAHPSQVLSQVQATPAPQQPIQQQQQQPQPQQQAPLQPPTRQSPGMFERPFTNAGVPFSFRSWLIPGKQDQAATLYNNLYTILGQQGIQASSGLLKEYGSLTPERNYITIRRGSATTFLYITPAGQHLYVSRTTTVSRPISPIRSTVAIAILVIAIILFLIQLWMGSNYYIDSVAPTRFFLTFLSYGLFTFLVGAAIHSFILFLTEKDFLAYLRPKHLSDFQMDEVATLESLTDLSLRDIVQQLGISSQGISSPTESYQPRQKVRNF